MSENEKGSRIFTNGIEISNRLKGSYDIRTGEHNAFVPRNFSEIPLLDHDQGLNNDILSGEALFLPKGKPISILLGRDGEICDVKIDTDFSDVENITGDFLKNGRADALAELSSLNEDIKERNLGELTVAVDPSDTAISRVALQISRHPSGVTTLTHLVFSDYVAIGPRVIWDENGKCKDTLLFGDSITLKDGDTILVTGSKRFVALRYFDKKPEDGGEFDKPTFIKQSFPQEGPLDEIHVPVEEIHDWIYNKGQ